MDQQHEQAQRKQPYPSDVSDDEWAFVAPYLTLMTETASQREHSLREVFNGLRWIVRSGAQWRMMPKDLPPWPWYTVYRLPTNPTLAEEGRSVRGHCA